MTNYIGLSGNQDELEILSSLFYDSSLCLKKHRGRYCLTSLNIEEFTDFQQMVDFCKKNILPILNGINILAFDSLEPISCDGAEIDKGDGKGCVFIFCEATLYVSATLSMSVTKSDGTVIEYHQADEAPSWLKKAYVYPAVEQCFKLIAHDIQTWNGVYRIPELIYKQLGLFNITELSNISGISKKQLKRFKSSSYSKRHDNAAIVSKPMTISEGQNILSIIVRGWINTQRELNDQTITGSNQIISSKQNNIELIGDNHILFEISSVFNKGEILIEKESERYWINSKYIDNSSKENCIESTKKMVTILTGICRILLKPNTIIKAIIFWDKEQDPETIYFDFNKKEEYLEKNTNCKIIPQNPNEYKYIRDWYRLSQSDSMIATLFCKISEDFSTPSSYSRIFEYFENNIPDIKQYEWYNSIEIDHFFRTFNSLTASGIDSRHGYDKSCLLQNEKPMAVGEAKSLIKNIIFEFLNEKEGSD